jgi:hypothetical protein
MECTRPRGITKRKSTSWGLNLDSLHSKEAGWGLWCAWWWLLNLRWPFCNKDR